MAGDWSSEEIPYDILQLSQGHEASEVDIKKAFRKLALLKHPDKNRNNPNAAVEFDQLQKAQAILLDPKAREAWDKLARQAQNLYEPSKAKQAREAKQAGQTAKRQKAMRDLEARERAFQSDRQAEQEARAKLKAELARLKEEYAAKAAKMEHQRELERVSAQMAASTSSMGHSTTAQPLEEMRRTLKVSWDRRDGGYTAAQLREVFEAYGPVVDIVMRDSKKKPDKGSALVIMATTQGAAEASLSVNGRAEAPLLVVPLQKTAQVAADADPPAFVQPPSLRAMASSFPGGAAQPHASAQPAFAATFPAGRRTGASSFPAMPPSQTGPNQNSFGSFAAGQVSNGDPNAAAPLVGGGNRDFENVTLMKMRQKAERARVIAEMEAKGEY